MKLISLTGQIRNQLTCLTLLVISLGCGGKTKPKTADFSGRTFNAKLPDTSTVFKSDPTNAGKIAKSTLQYVFNRDTTGELRIRNGMQLQQAPFVWKIEDDSIRMRFSTVDGRLYVKKEQTGYELFNDKFRVVLTPVD